MDCRCFVKVGLMAKTALLIMVAIVLTITLPQLINYFPRMTRIRQQNALLNVTSFEDCSTKINESKRLEEKDCDYDCRRLRRELKRWPLNKPRAFIYFLFKSDRLNRMISSLTVLDKYFNNKFHYPVIIFHEKTPSFEQDRLQLLSKTKSDLYFQPVTFEKPDFLPRNLTQRSCTWSLGYRNMCRFHAKQIYEQPILSGFDYAWRLDDDSEILQPIDYDVFEYMHSNSLLYGYVIVTTESPDCVVNLWDSAEFYIKYNSIKPTFFQEWRKYTIYYNNFEISRLSLWLSNDYQNFVKFLDALGGIYYYRWGDAPIKTLAVSIFVPRNKSHYFRNVRYSHQSIEN